MADNKISLPQSGGGLVRYSDASTSRISMSPAAVIVIIVLAMILIIILHAVKPFT